MQAARVGDNLSSGKMSELGIAGRKGEDEEWKWQLWPYAWLAMSRGVKVTAFQSH